MARHTATVVALAVAVFAVVGCSNDPTTASADSSAATSDAWLAYAQRSAQRMAADKARIDAELTAAGRTAATSAPYLASDFKLDGTMTDAFFRGATATAMAASIVSFQTATGGWSKHVDFTQGPRHPGQAYNGETTAWEYIGTLDNWSTVSELQFLARAYQQQGVPAWRDAFVAGVEYLLMAQYPNGCWPQVYPLMGGYHDAVTFNDDAMTHALQLFRDIGRGGVYAFVPADLVVRVNTSLAAGIRCVTSSQLAVSGTLTAWGQQHDARSLAPVAGRSYELPGIASQESASVMSLLMSLTAPDAATMAAVHAAADWLRATQIFGYTYDQTNGLRAQSGAGPIWARIAEIGTNRPIFANRDGVKLYDFDLLTDRRTGYSWFMTTPAAALSQYTAWAAAHPR